MLQYIRDFRVYAYTVNVSGVRVHTNILQCIRVYHSIWVVYIIPRVFLKHRGWMRLNNYVRIACQPQDHDAFVCIASFS